MNAYRCYFLDKDDHIESADWIEALSLQDAIEQALAMCEEVGSCAIELWQGPKRLHHASARTPATV